MNEQQWWSCVAEGPVVPEMYFWHNQLRSDGTSHLFGPRAVTEVSSLLGCAEATRRDMSEQCRGGSQ